MKKLLLIISIILALNSQAQIRFEKTYGGSSNDYGSAIVNTYDGGYLFTVKYSNQGFTIIRTDSLGDTLWTKGTSYVGLSAQIRDAIQTRDSNFVLLTSNYHLVKIDSIGDTLWVSKLKPVSYYSIAEDLQGDIIAIGEKIIGGQTCCSAEFIKVKKNGVIDTSFTSNYYCWGSSGCMLGKIIIASDGNYIISSGTLNSGPPTPGLIKMDTSGTVLWEKTYYGKTLLPFADILQLKDSSFLMVGEFIYAPNGTDLYKADKGGNFKSVTQFNGNQNKWYGKSIAETDGGYLISGANDDIYLMKIDTSYSFVWSRTIGGSADDDLDEMIATTDGGAVIIGYTESFGAGNYDAYFVKTDSIGLLTNLSRNSSLGLANFNIYPNPTQGQITISEVENIEWIKVFNIHGQRVDEIVPNAQGESEFQLKGPSGIYFIQFQMEDGSVQSTKVVKE